MTAIEILEERIKERDNVTSENQVIKPFVCNTCDKPISSNFYMSSAYNRRIIIDTGMKVYSDNQEYILALEKELKQLGFLTRVEDDMDAKLYSVYLLEKVKNEQH